MMNSEMHRFDISRRSLLLGAAGLVAAEALPSFARAQEPKKGGTLRIGINGGSVTDTLDPTQLVGSFPINVSRQVYNTLIEIKDDGTPGPELAESWEAADGNKRWVFKLRKGVTFHNGQELTSEDVKYSLQLHMGKDTKSKVKLLAKTIAEIKTANPLEMELILSSPNPDMQYVLSDLHFAIVPKGFSDWSMPVGTGPFVLETMEPGVIAVANRNKSYWRTDRAHVDRVETTVINDLSARISAMQSGTVDLINAIDYKLAKHLKKSPDIKLVVTEGKQHFSFPMDARVKPFSNPNVVLALKHAFDRQQMVDLLLGGYGKVGNDHPIPESDPNFNPDIAQTIYDPEKAKFHLQKAGLKSLQLQLSASTTAFEEAVNTAELFAEKAKAANIGIEVHREPEDGYWSDIWMKKPWAASFWAGRPSASMMLSSVYSSEAPWNETHWTNQEFDSKLAEALSLADEAKRREIYFELQQIIHDQCPTIIPAFASWVDAANKNVKGFVPNPNFNLSDHRVAERVWLEN